MKFSRSGKDSVKTIVALAWVVGFGSSITSLAGCQHSREQVNFSRAAAAPTEVSPSERLVPEPIVQLSAHTTPANQTSYVRLGVDECQRSARAQAPLATSLLELSELPAADRSRDSAAHQELRRHLAAYLAEDLRRRSAAAGLELYFRLQEAELLHDLLLASIQEVEATLNEADIAKRAGATLPEELSKAREARAELINRDTELEVGIQRLNAELKSLLQLSLVQEKLLPADAVVVAPLVENVQTLQETALARRTDLAALRMLLQSVTSHNGPVVQQLLSALAPGVASAVAPWPNLNKLMLLCKNLDDTGLRYALHSAVQEKEQAILKEVSIAYEELTTRQQALPTLRKLLEEAEKRYEDAKIRANAGQLKPTTMREIHLELLKIQADYLKSIYLWKYSELSLRAGLGLL